ncbi:hypothetical protein BJ742DRAFT_805751 [Cladochytrium replicatum]|nr:hypothetical protein BJ742DRAFT_805751 [Cladochytrium replicatum]
MASSVANSARQTFLRDVRPGVNGLAVNVIILDKRAECQTTKQGVEVWTVWAADETGSISCAVYGEVGGRLRPGDIIRATGVKAVLHKDTLSLSISAEGPRDRDGIPRKDTNHKIRKVGEDTLVFSEAPNYSHAHWERDPQDPTGPLTRRDISRKDLHLQYPWLPMYRQSEADGEGRINNVARNQGTPARPTKRQRQH